MSDPVLVGTYGNAFIYYVCDRNPTTSEPLVYNNYSDLLLLWWNTTDNTFFWSVDDTEDAMVWVECINSNNLQNMLLTSGWFINTNRSYSLRSSPAFNTNYNPSSTNDVFVLATVNVILSILQSSTISAQINSGSGFVTIATASNSSVAINNTSTLSFIVPAGSTYKIVSSGTGTNNLNQIMELSL